ncbi:hypothetical protein ACT453_33050, partial [Bacillus sp. D-CC]
MIANKQLKIKHRFAETVKLEDSNAVVAPDGTVTKKATKVTTKEVQNKDPLYIEPKVNKKYMMFLKKDQLFGNYYGAIEPFAITFDENKTLQPLKQPAAISEHEIQKERKHSNL